MRIKIFGRSILGHLFMETPHIRNLEIYLAPSYNMRLRNVGVPSAERRLPSTQHLLGDYEGPYGGLKNGAVVRNPTCLRVVKLSYPNETLNFFLHQDLTTLNPKP